jgi:RNA polymerase sigma-70 factor (ECF subfamily)
MKPVESEPFHLKYSSLVVQAGQGNCNAMGQLAAAAKPGLFAYLCRLTSNFDIAEDLTQDVLLEMVRSIRNLRQPSCFWGWLYRIAFNQFQSYYRRHKIRQSAEQTLIAHLIQQQQSRQDQPGPSQCRQSELSGAVFTAIQRLEHQNQSILKLRCFDQRTYVDIADAFDTSENNIRVRFHRAKQALKKELAGSGFSQGA